MGFLNKIFKKKTGTVSRLNGTQIVSFEKVDSNNFSYLYFKLSDGQKVSAMIPSMKYSPKDSDIYVPSNCMMAFCNPNCQEPLTEEEAKQFCMMIVIFANEKNVNLFVS